MDNRHLRMPAAPSAISPAQSVLQMRTAARAIPALSPADRAAVRSRICQDTIAQLSAMDARAMTPADFDRLAQAKAELAEIAAMPAPVDSDPDMDEALRRARAGRLAVAA